MMSNSSEKYVLAFDTSNEVIAVGIGRLDAENRCVKMVVHEEIAAHRASNTQLLPHIDALCKGYGIERECIACVAVGRGPGSFTGVRISMATAKGIASALEIPLIGLSTQASIANAVWLQGHRGKLLVASDAMRKEIYPAYFYLSDDGILRLSPDRVIKAAEFAQGKSAHDGSTQGESSHGKDARLLITGDALAKYDELLSPMGEVLSSHLWTPTGEGLLFELERLWRRGEVDPFDAARHDPMEVLPIYTRLSDAEENEREKLASSTSRNLRTGVQGADVCGAEIQFQPFDSAFVEDAAEIEKLVMGTDAWSASMIEDELPRRNRTWWMALNAGELIGYAGGMLASGDMQVLKVAVLPEWRRRKIASELLSRIAYDAENLAATTMSLEVRKLNEGAQKFYQHLGFMREGVRPRYYSDGEDAVIMQARLPLKIASSHMAENLIENFAESADAHVAASASDSALNLGLSKPVILAIESSCDETAASVIDGDGHVLSDVVSSQIDFHARFGGVVPEIASRKHVEAIASVARAALDDASGNVASTAADAADANAAEADAADADDAARTNTVAEAAASRSLRWRDLDAIAVTQFPGLVGALVVGVAFAKGASWALDIPLIGVNHLEGHLYANKLAPECAEVPFEPPAVVSIVSGGNTMLVHMRDWQSYAILGETIDDAVGEAFDKVAKVLGLPYPGGPHISRLAAEGDPASVDFPRALLHSGDYRFSLSGLKTAVATYIQKERASGAELDVSGICASFEQAVIDVQVAKAARALDETGARTFCLGGGVAANLALRKAYEQMCAARGVRIIMPPAHACGDNAAMIALVALDRYKQGAFASLDMDAHAHADLSKPY